MRVCAVLLGVLAMAVPALAGPPAYRVASFEVDVTVPMGHALMGGGIAPASEVIDPLSARGIALLGPEPAIVWVAVDWCEIRNDAYDAWRDALAQAAGTTRERVLLAAVHQHDTPVADFTAQKILDEAGLPRSLCDVDFVRECIARTADALKAAIPQAQVVTHYGVGEADVREIASNRRVVAADGSVSFARNSSTPDPAMHDAPAGLIDPTLRTLSFWNGETPVAAMSSYAVHPMSYYGKGGVSADFPGAARRAMEQSLRSMPYLYFSGCSGDVVAGKYNDGTPPHRGELADRLAGAMRAAWSNTKQFGMEEARFRAVSVDLKPRDTAGYSESDARKTVADTNAKPFDRNLAAMGLSWRAALAAGRGVNLYLVDFGRAKYVLMPAESFVEYQLTAQRLFPESTVLVAGYGESAPGYIPSASAVAELFIEQHNWCWVGSDAPFAMNDALARLAKP